MPRTKARNVRANSVTVAGSASDFHRLDARINELEAKIAVIPLNAAPAGPGDPGRVTGRHTPPGPDSDLHGLNLRVYDLENRVSDLESQVYQTVDLQIKGHSQSLRNLDSRIQHLEQQAIQSDQDVHFTGNIEVDKNVTVHGDVILV